MPNKLIKILINLGFLIFGLYLAVWGYQHGHFDGLLNLSLPFKLLAAFIAGILYTSFFSAAVSVAIMLIIIQSTDPLVVAVVAGFGSVLGDLLIIKTFRAILGQLKFLSFNHLPISKKVNNFFKSLHLSLLAYIIGAVIIALPLPDEIGLVLIGASKLSLFKLAVLTYILNTTGILMILIPLSTI